MSELFKIVLTAGFTVVVGIAIFVVQQFLLEPLTALRLVIGKVGFALVYYAEVYANPLQTDAAAAQDPKKEHIEESIKLLREISLSLFEPKSFQRATIQRSCDNADRVRVLLRLSSIQVK